MPLPKIERPDQVFLQDGKPAKRLVRVVKLDRAPLPAATKEGSLLSAEALTQANEQGPVLGEGEDVEK